MKKNKEITKSVRMKIELTVMRFDFEKVRSAMRTLGWTWGGGEGHYPEKEDMVTTAIELLEAAYNSQYAATGGFEARYIDKEFYLNFVVEGTDSWVDDGKDEVEEVEKTVKGSC